MTSKRVNDIDGLVAKRVRAQRMRLGMTQLELGERLGLTFQQVQKYEKGINRIGAGRLFEMARIFNVPVQALFPDSDEALREANGQTAEVGEIADFMQTTDGWRLGRAFVKIEDAELRKRIIALIEGIIAR
jgi:transcriptional regulator with XRE-family HTH domain